MKRVIIVCLDSERNSYLKKYLKFSPKLVKGDIIERIVAPHETVTFVSPYNPKAITALIADEVVVSDLAFEDLTPEQYEAINSQIKRVLFRGEKCRTK